MNSIIETKKQIEEKWREIASKTGEQNDWNFDDIVDEASEYIDKALDQIAHAVIEDDIDLITTHTEHNGSYCDTGEDMEWSCRSDCVDMAVKRLQSKLSLLEQQLK